MERSNRDITPPTPASPIKTTNGDAEQLRIGVAVDENNYICLHFGKAVAWVGMPAQMAADLGAELIRHAVNTAEKTGVPLEIKP